MTMRAAMMSGAGILLVCSLTSGCSKSVKGNTYANNGSVVRIEFQADGKAQVAMGPMNQTCTWSESSSKVTLNCEGDMTVFTENSDGSLSGPPDGMLARLVKVKS